MKIYWLLLIIQIYGCHCLVNVIQTIKSNLTEFVKSFNLSQVERPSPLGLWLYSNDNNMYRKYKEFNINFDAISSFHQASPETLEIFKEFLIGNSSEYPASTLIGACFEYINDVNKKFEKLMSEINSNNYDSQGDSTIFQSHYLTNFTREFECNKDQLPQEIQIRFTKDYWKAFKVCDTEESFNRYYFHLYLQLVTTEVKKFLLLAVYQKFRSTTNSISKAFDTLNQQLNSFGQPFIQSSQGLRTYHRSCDISVGEQPDDGETDRGYEKFDGFGRLTAFSATTSKLCVDYATDMNYLKTRAVCSKDGGDQCYLHSEDVCTGFLNPWGHSQCSAPVDDFNECRYRVGRGGARGEMIYAELNRQKTNVQTFGAKTAACDDSRMTKWTKCTSDTCCLCTCIESNQYISLDLVTSNVDENMVITGVAIKKINDTFFLQIKQSKLNPFGKVLSQDSEPVPINVNTDNKQRLTPITHMRLETIWLDKDEVITGIGFIYKRSQPRFTLRIRGSKFDFVTGIISKDSNRTVPQFLPFEHKQLDIPNIIPSGVIDNYHLDNAEVRFRISGYMSDFGQSILPYMETIFVNSIEPLRGVRLFYKYHEGESGFISLLLEGFDYQEYLKSTIVPLIETLQ